MSGRYAIVRTPGHWVFCGEVERVDEVEIVLARAVIIRVFNTSRGINHVILGNLHAHKPKVSPKIGVR